MPYMTRLPSDLSAWGLTVRTVDGWQTRGKSSFAPLIALAHWTGTAQRPGVNLPTLNVLVRGHGSLPGPLCQVAHARDGSVTVVAAGRANHGGRGSWGGATGNSGAYGVESEANGPRSWTPEQRFTYPIVMAALIHGLGRGAEYVASHAEFALPRGRKVDINGWPDGEMRGFRRRVAALLAAGPAASPLHHFASVESAIAALGPDPVPVTGPRTLALQDPQMFGTDVAEVAHALGLVSDPTNPRVFFGNGMDRAVREFQASRGIAVDGRVGPTTLAALATASPAGAAAAGSTDTTFTDPLKEGPLMALTASEQTELLNGVRALQRELATTKVAVGRVETATTTVVNALSALRERVETVLSALARVDVATARTSVDVAAIRAFVQPKDAPVDPEPEVPTDPDAAA